MRVLLGCVSTGTRFLYTTTNRARVCRGCEGGEREREEGEFAFREPDVDASAQLSVAREHGSPCARA